MKLSDVKIENFRGIRSLELPLDDLTVLIGENNTGKSTVLEAIRLVLTRSFGSRRNVRFTEYDFHLSCAEATPQTAEPISITLHFAEAQEGDWPESISQQLGDVIQLESDGRSHIWLQAKGYFELESSTFETKWIFLNSSGGELILKNASSLALISRFVPVFFLSALRDSSQEFGQRGQFWSSFLKSIQLSDEQREQIENMLGEINASVISANSSLTEVTKKLADTSLLVQLAASDPVVLEAIPTRVFDMVGKIQVHLKSHAGAKLPLNRHGEGTQSIAVLMLFQAFTGINLTEDYTAESTPLLALEEPEAHLHPSAIRSLGSFLETITGQALVTSHSGDLISRVPVKALRRIYKHGFETKVGFVHDNLFSERELQAIDYSIRLTKGYYLFSRCWLLVEGESDFHLMPLLFELLGHSQDRASFSVLEISQVIDKGEPFIKLANALGIEWFIMADGDSAGKDYISRAMNYCQPGTVHTQTLAGRDIEHEFWYNGFQDFFERLVTPNQKNNITSKANGSREEEIRLSIKAAIKSAGGKPAFAQALISEVRARGESTIPQSIQDTVAHVIRLSGG